MRGGVPRCGGTAIDFFLQLLGSAALHVHRLELSSSQVHKCERVMSPWMSLPCFLHAVHVCIRPYPSIRELIAPNWLRNERETFIIFFVKVWEVRETALVAADWNSPFLSLHDGMQLQGTFPAGRCKEHACIPCRQGSRHVQRSEPFRPSFPAHTASKTFQYELLGPWCV
jgi:hypothetical protein